MFFLQEIRDDDTEQLVLTHNCTSVFLQQSCSNPADWEIMRELQWNCQPVSMIPVYPYILAMSADNLEVRSQVNGTLLQTLNMPKLKCLTYKVMT